MKRKSYVDYFLTEDVLKRNKINDEYSTVHSTVQNYNAYSSSSEQDWSYQNLHRQSEDLIHSYSSHHNYIDNSHGSSSYSNSISMSNKTSNYNSNYSVSKNNSHVKYRPNVRTTIYNDSYSRSANNNTTRPYIDDRKSTNNNNHNNKIYGQYNNSGYQYNNDNNNNNNYNILNEQKYNSTGNEYNIFKQKRAPYQSGKYLNYDPDRDDYNSHYINQIELRSPASNKNLESYLNDSISISISSDMFFPGFNVLFEGYNKYIILLILLFVYKYATE
jgi:hypothetical protein